MKQKFYLPVLLTILFAAFPFMQTLYAQTDDQKLTATILEKDSLFWITYNTCDTAGNRKFFTTDVEFFHDKSGLTLGAENLVAAMKNNLCSSNDFRLRREAVKGSIQVFPLHDASGIYGAIISGEHLFYINEKGKPERLDGQARFTHVWTLKEGDWRMSRILSYDHHAPAYSNKRNAIKLPAATLEEWVGKYEGKKSGVVTVRREKEGLLLLTNKATFVLHPETPNRFFINEHDLAFEFFKDEKGKVSKMVVRESGEVAEEAIFKSKQ